MEQTYLKLVSAHAKEVSISLLLTQWSILKVIYCLLLVICGLFSLLNFKVLQPVCHTRALQLWTAVYLPTSSPCTAVDESMELYLSPSVTGDELGSRSLDRYILMQISPLGFNVTCTIFLHTVIYESRVSKTFLAHYECGFSLGCKLRKHSQ